jgi:hypothetical protein
VSVPVRGELGVEIQQEPAGNSSIYCLLCPGIGPTFPPLCHSSCNKTSPNSRQSSNVPQTGHLIKWSASLSIGCPPMTLPGVGLFVMAG